MLWLIPLTCPAPWFNSFILLFHSYSTTGHRITEETLQYTSLWNLEFKKNILNFWFKLIPIFLVLLKFYLFYWSTPLSPYFKIVVILLSTQTQQTTLVPFPSFVFCYKFNTAFTLSWYCPLSLAIWNQVLYCPHLLSQLSFL